ncbi:hypothetical protein EPO44_08635 [bacterium]|nr:MAG: hypothetical protein EPO44_08635 [bacterium]
MYFAAKDQWWSGYESWQIVARNIGSLCVVSVAITFLWELFGKRAFRDELLAKAGLSQEIRTAGLTKITDSFLRDLDWEPLFRTVSKLDIFFAYGQTWRNTHWEKLVAAASRGIRVRVVLPDPEHDATVTELAKRFNYTKDRVVELIKGAEKEFSQLGSKSSGAGTTVDIWYLPAAPLLTFYRFDFKAVIALYTHRTERVPVPAFVVESPGTLYNFVRQEFDAMIDQKSGMAKCITRK